uniref:Hook microtubule-tethering protein 3 n=1 Tax=Rattus norvegicus TaxID=10116 RepID=A0A8I5ZUA0_RAT
MERLNQSDSIEDPNSPAGRRHLQLQTQLEQLFKIRNSCLKLVIEGARMARTVKELAAKPDSLSSLPEPARAHTHMHSHTHTLTYMHTGKDSVLGPMGNYRPRLEAAKDDYRIRCEELEKEISELRQQNDELTTLADEAQSLKDEIDVLRHSSDKVSKLEGQVESYKKKLEDLGDLRRQVKLLEEKNTMYMQNTVSLEEELRKANAARGQLETYKRQVVELQNRLSDESKKADKLDFEYKRLKEKVDGLQKEKDRLRTERDSLKETIEELRCVQAQEGHRWSGSRSLASVTPHQYSILIRSPVVALCHGDPVPLEQQDWPFHTSQTIRPVQSPVSGTGWQLNWSALLCCPDEDQGLLSQVLQLVRAGLALPSSHPVGSFLRAGLMPLGSQESSDSLAAEIVTPEIREKLIRLQHENKMLKINQEGSDNEKIALLQSLLDDANLRKNELETENRLVNQRLLEVQSQVEELQKSLQDQGSKAEDVIRTLDPKQNQGAAPEIQALKNQLQERDRLFHSLEKEYEKTKTQRDMEEKYIVSAWYNMGMTLHKKAAEDRLASTGSGQSFLARQRQATSTRRSYPGHVQPATASLCFFLKFTLQKFHLALVTYKMVLNLNGFSILNSFNNKTKNTRKGTQSLVKLTCAVCQKDADEGAGEVLCWVRACSALAEDLSLVPAPLVRQVITTYNSSSRGLPCLGLRIPHTDTHS